MTDELKPNDENKPQPAGVLGDGALQAGKYNMALVRRAMREGWPIPPAYRARVSRQMNKIVEKSDNERNQIAAARVLVSADAVNVRRIATAAAIVNGGDQHQTNVNVNVGLKIETHENWYGNDAHDKLAARTAAPDPDLDGPEPVQAGGMRETFRQNGHGTNGSHKGPRPDTEDV